MAAKKVSGSNLKHALDKFGSLHEANEGLENENQALGKQIAQLKQENVELKQNRDNMLTNVKDLDNRLTRQKELLQLQSI